MSVNTIDDRYRRVKFKGKKKALKVSDQGKDMVNSLTEDYLAVPWRMDYKKHMTPWEGCDNSHWNDVPRYLLLLCLWLSPPASSLEPRTELH